MKRTFSEIKIDKLVPYSEHLFSLYDGERLKELSESIKLHGVLTPLIVRKYDLIGNYMILSGHNRANASKLAGLTSVPCIIVEKLTEQEEKLIVIETNFYQRSIDNIKTSELAKTIAEWYNLLKSQGFRRDMLTEIEQIERENERLEMLENGNETNEKKSHEKSALNPHKTEVSSTSGHIGQLSSESAEIIAEKTKLSPRNVRRYVRVAKLSDELLVYVDNEAIPFLAAVELSYLSKSQQNYILNVLQLEDLKIKTISVAAAKALRLKNEKDKLQTFKDVVEALKPITIKKIDTKVTLKSDFVSQYFINTPKKDVIKKVKKSVELTEKKIPELLDKYGFEISEDEDIYGVIYDMLQSYCEETENEE